MNRPPGFIQRVRGVDMKTGVCCGIENIKTLENLGIGEIELSASWISQLDDEDFQRIKNSLDNSRVGSHVCNALMHKDVVPLFADTDFESTSSYLNKLMPRLAMLDVKYVVFGSGNYRKIPENIVSSEISHSGYVFKRISEFLMLLSDIAVKFNITIVIEPLNHNETNVILTSSEAMEYINALKRDNIALLIDLYHFDLENESFENIVKFKNHIKHIHIARPVKRTCPSSIDDYEYREFFDAVKKAQYSGIISIEASTVDFAKDISNAQILFESFYREIV